MQAIYMYIVDLQGKSIPVCSGHMSKLKLKEDLRPPESHVGTL